MAVAILDKMQEFDQQVAPARSPVEERTNRIKRARIDLPAFRRLPRPTPRCLGLFRNRVHKDATAQSCIT
jgi:hypothetical protein